jgi:hypothetical protein
MRLIFALTVLLFVVAVESFHHQHSHRINHVNRHRLPTLISMTRLRMSDSEPQVPKQDSEQAEESSSTNAASNPNPVYSNSMEEVVNPKTGFTEEKGAFDIGLLIAFPIMVGTLGFFLFFPYIAPQLAANSP